MTSTYSVVITGEYLDGFEPESVEASFAELFKIQQDKVTAYFSGQPKVLKKSVDEQTAIKYKKRIEKVGASVELRSASQSQSTQDKTQNVVQDPQIEEKSPVDSSTENHPHVIPYSDQSMNAIEAGRMKKIQKMEAVQLAEESDSLMFKLVGLIMIAFALIDSTLSLSGIFSILGNLWIDAGCLIIGLAALKSSRIN